MLHFVLQLNQAHACSMIQVYAFIQLRQLYYLYTYSTQKLWSWDCPSVIILSTWLLKLAPVLHESSFKVIFQIIGWRSNLSLASHLEYWWLWWQKNPFPNLLKEEEELGEPKNGAKNGTEEIPIKAVVTTRHHIAVPYPIFYGD